MNFTAVQYPPERRRPGRAETAAAMASTTARAQSATTFVIGTAGPRTRWFLPAWGVALRDGGRYVSGMSYLLIVDDDLDGRTALCQFLEKSGHEVTCAANGREALASILARTPDLIVLDL